MADDLTTSAWEDFGSAERMSRIRAGRIGWLRAAKTAFIALAALYVAATIVRVWTRKYYVFLPHYMQWAIATPAAGAPGAPTHVFLIFTDHFEPDYDLPRLKRWAARYRDMAARHRDHDGRAPQHSFFYPGEQADAGIFGVLRELTQAHLGEVELHYHHDFDTEETLRPKLETAIENMQKVGFLKTIDGQTHFAFVHGNWGLDNSNGPELCGVNTELRLLKEEGCFADFTFPSVYQDAQPPFVNSIYAAKDDDGPKSYARALSLKALMDGSADLMIFQGPLIFAPSLSVRRLFFDLDDGDIHGSIPASPARVDRWMRAGIHVASRPDWVFIKIFAHGVSTIEDENAVVGPTFDTALTYLERRYNDGQRYVLHYITSREAYNLVVAAVRGATGDPEQYFDSPIPPYLANQPDPEPGSDRAPAQPLHTASTAR
jgi:hypothetical protein